MMMILRILSAFILTCTLAAYGKGEPDLNKLTREITKNAKGAISVRKNRVDPHVVFTEKSDSLILDEKASKADGLTLRLRKWSCAGQEPTECDWIGVPVEYVVHPQYIDPASVKRSPIDAKKGESAPLPDETGHAIEFSCSAAAPAPCLEFAGIGGFGDYKSCRGQSCESYQDKVRTISEGGAEVWGKTRAAQGHQTIECASEKKCAKVEAALRELVAFAASLSPTNAADQKDDTDKDAAAAKRLHASHPFVLEFLDAFDRTDRPDFATLSAEVKTLNIHRRKGVRFTEDGRFAFDVEYCDRKVEAASACASPAEFWDATLTWSIADIDPGPKGLRVFQTGPDGKPVEPTDPQAAFALAVKCADGRKCIEMRSGDAVQHGNATILPCGGGEPADFFSCGQALMDLVIEYDNFNAFYPENDETGSQKSKQAKVEKLSEKVIDKLVASLDKASRGAVLAEENADENRAVGYAAGRGIGVAEKVFHRGEGVQIGPDGRLRIETRVCASNEGEPCDGKAEWEKHILYLALDKLDPASIEALGDARRKVGAVGGGESVDMWSYDLVLDKSGLETELSGWAVFAACRGGDATLCAAIPGIKTYGFDIFFPCADKKRCKAAAEALSRLVSFAATDDFRSWREAHEKAARAPTEIKSRKDAEKATSRISQALSGNTYRLYASDIKESFLITPTGAALTGDNALAIDVAYCRKQGDHWFAPFGDAPCGVAPEIGGVDTVRLTDVDPEVFEIAELTSMTDGMVVKFPCREGQKCEWLPIGRRRQLTGPTVYTPCKELETCMGLARDIAGLALWAREDVAWLGELVDEAEKVAKEGQSAKKSAAQLVAEIARHAKGAEFKYYDDEASEFVLVKTAGVSLTPDGRLQADFSVCSYPSEANDLSLFSDYREKGNDGAGYWNRKNGDYVDYWNPKDDDAGAGNPDKDSRRCESAGGWESVRSSVALGDLDLDVYVGFGAHIHSYDEKGSLKEGFDAAASSFSVTALCGTKEACIEVAGAATLADLLEIPCRDKAACDAIVTAFDELGIAASPEGEEPGAETAASDPFAWDNFVRALTGKSPKELDEILSDEDIERYEELFEEVERLAKEGQSSKEARAANDLVGVWKLQGVGTLEFRADGAYSFTHPTFSHSGVYTAENGVWSQTSQTPTNPWVDGGTYQLIDRDTLYLVGKLGGAVWTRQ